MTESPTLESPTRPALESSDNGVRSDREPSDGNATVQKWGRKKWEADIFETDDKNMTLITMRRLINELCLLKETLEDYDKFNKLLGGKYRH